MVDVAPSLYERVNNEFNRLLKANKQIQKLNKKIRDKKATYEDANIYAVIVGDIMAKAFNRVTSSDLPDGRMYYNIAERVIRPNLEESHDIVADMAEDVQNLLNNEAKLGIKPIRPNIDNNRVNGLIERISAEDYAAVSWLLGEPIRNFHQNIVDESVRKNAAFQKSIGLYPKIIRKAEAPGIKSVTRGKKKYFYVVPCKWCAALDGEYEYAEVSNRGNDVFRRHENCRCLVMYVPANGRYAENVHNKKMYDTQEDAERENRIEVANRILRREDPTTLRDMVNKIELSKYNLSESGKKRGQSLKEFKQTRLREQAQNTPKNRLAVELSQHAKNIERLEDKLANPTAYLPNYYDKSEKARREITHKWQRELINNKDSLKIKYDVYEDQYL